MESSIDFIRDGDRFVILVMVIGGTLSQNHVTFSHPLEVWFLHEDATKFFYPSIMFCTTPNKFRDAVIVSTEKIWGAKTTTVSHEVIVSILPDERERVSDRSIDQEMG
jgi:hypothetical protein